MFSFKVLYTTKQRQQLLHTLLYVHKKNHEKKKNKILFVLVMFVYLDVLKHGREKTVFVMWNQRT
jgi:hypothetical protein